MQQNIDTGINWGNPISEELPAGPDMQYSPEFAELEAAVTGTPEQQYGSVVIPAKGPEWQRVLELATALSRKTYDLRVLLQISRALTRLHGLAGLKAGLDALGNLLKSQWEHVHPQTLIDGIEDPQMRFGVLSEFAAVDGLVSDVRQATVIDTALGAFTVRELERVTDQGSIERNGASISRDQLDQMVRDLNQQPDADALKLPGQLLQMLGDIRRGIEAHAGTEFTPDLMLLMRPLERVNGLFQGALQLEAPAAPQDGESPAPVADALNLPGGALTSRAAVIQAMDAICAYLERNEPTNPAPLLIRRARRLMNMNFLDIVKSVSPDGINQVMFVVGPEAEGEVRR